MRFKNREISIFSLSTLDVIFGALGAFMIMMLATMSGYNPDAVSRDELDEAERGQRLVFFTAEWLGNVDVDLWIEANGELTGPKPELFPDTNEREWDDHEGAGGSGVESRAFEGAQGTYRVFYNLHDARGREEPVTVRGWFVRNSADSYGWAFLGHAPLSAERVGEMIEIARFEIGSDGSLVDSETNLW